MVAERRRYDRAITGTAFAITSDDGRSLEGWASEGDGRTAVLLQVGTPSAGLAYGPMVDAAVARGHRFVTYSRPGYAGSTRQVGRSVADCASDVAAIAEHLGLERLHVVGWSGGGPHALACAALLPDHVGSAATLAGVAPFDAAGLDWLDGMAEENREEFGATIDGPAALEAFLRKAAEGMRDRTGPTIAAALGGLVTEVDRRALTGALADYVAAMMRAALADGFWGWYDDDLAFARDWGFSLDDITVPVTVWHGREDAFVPYAHGGWLAEHVPGARAKLFDDEGHISLVTRFDDIVDDLVAS